MTSTTERIADRLVDRTVVGGYTSVGYLLRRPWWRGDPAPGSLQRQRAVVTGAGSGLGEATALGLARLGATVHLVGRTADRVRPAMERISRRLSAEGLPARLHAEACDVADLSDVRRFARDLSTRLAADGDALDVLVHNAGVLPARRAVSPDGHELTMATHVLGPVLMTDLLAPVLRRSRRGARVVLVSSGGMYTQALPVSDPEYLAEPYRGAVAYARSKRVQVELVPVLAERFAADATAVHAMHPGWADTPGVASSLPLFRAVTRPFLRSATQGADTVVWLAATRPPAPSGHFWHDRAARPTSYRTATEPTAEQRSTMWRWVQEATGVDG